MAYALYKYKKHILATDLRNKRKSENIIPKEVNTFHDQTLQNNRLEDYRDKATNYLHGLIQQVEKT
ncbi:hypothetical protein KKJ09_09245 [Xenorhabdus bovienii]|uniref:hypothetical protein n=1 Tax=Xenorhabdus bovienii TaxID=40576 RepID=UPI0023B2898D|nr:hypothetical protein [Xenorhabdus bovienii]MDE9493776.1 hypothetical protein [Xenorhabdus bovienii]MDE9502313.1 hypothetical protein [Xenorhabdus bovienii]MDE9526792.1 hypothetical protein [Xenorhabdus bovienii]